MTTTIRDHREGPFAIETVMQPGAPGGRAVFAVIHCRGCAATDKVLISGKSIAWARRVLRQKGWALSEHSAGRHICPACVRAEPHVPHHSRLKVALAQASSMDGLTGAELHRVPEDNQTGTVVIAEHIPGGDIMEKAEIAQALSAIGTVKVATSPGEPRSHAHRQHTGNYRPQGESRTHLRPGKRPAHTPNAYTVEVENPRKNQQRIRLFKTGGYRYPSDAAVRALEYLAAVGIERPQLDVDFVIWRREGRDCGWALVNPPVNPDDLTPTESPVIDPVPAAAQEATIITAEAPRTPSRQDIRSIQEALDKHYDVDAQRYSGTSTDTSLAVALDVPRAWVTTERERAYGPDGNQAGDIAMARWRRDMTTKLDAFAEKALALAAEAETLKMALDAGPKA